MKLLLKKRELTNENIDGISDETVAEEENELIKERQVMVSLMNL